MCIRDSFPTEYQAAELAGKAAVFKIKLHEVKYKELPDVYKRQVLEALGRTAPENDFEAMQQLEAVSAHTAPASLAALRQKPERFNTVIDPAPVSYTHLDVYKRQRISGTGVQKGPFRPDYPALQPCLPRLRCKSSVRRSLL